MDNFALTPSVEDDLLDIARYTIERWGINQAQRYEAILEKAFNSIGRGTERGRIFFKKRPDLRFIHVEHHYVFYLVEKGEVPLIIAVLHERMDFLARIKERLGT